GMSLRRRLQEILGLPQTEGIEGIDGGDYNDVDHAYSASKPQPSNYDDSVSYYPEHENDNVIAMPGLSSFQSELVILEPFSFQEVPAAILALRDRKVVVLNLSHLDAEDAQRAVDYVAGGTFALDGHQERIGKCVFLFTPHSVQITSQTTAMVANAVPPGYPPPPPPPPGYRSPTDVKDQEMLRKLKIQEKPSPSSP
ncbi:MAG: cell division protein SepF, partial [Merismopedia sp. SIO2A8]|nr:cell division protein SepF [Merismopedia sp. SIO2A8]